MQALVYLNLQRCKKLMATTFSIKGINWDRLVFINNERKILEIEKLYKGAADEISKMIIVAGIDISKPFNIKDYPALEARINRFLRELSDNTVTVIEQGILDSFTLANAKNEKLLQYISEKTGIDIAVLEEKYQFGARNAEAINAFLDRKTKGLKLSDRVWKNTKSAKVEIINAIELSVDEGIPAAKLSQLLRKSLIDPDKRFKKGSVNWKNYHPGQGVYRSSFKNAMRAARTEINMAYREADYQRWKSFDFVKGIEVRLSNNPNHCDVCASLVGEYPKDFKFIGWHPQCRCNAVPILLSEDEYNDFELAMLKEEEYKVTDSVNELPENFKNWYSDNQEKIKRAKNLPYFIRDNGKFTKKL